MGRSTLTADEVRSLLLSSAAALEEAGQMQLRLASAQADNASATADLDKWHQLYTEADCKYRALQTIVASTSTICMRAIGNIAAAELETADRVILAVQQALSPFDADVAAPNTASLQEGDAAGTSGGADAWSDALNDGS
jgi:hypothetical protein